MSHEIGTFLQPQRITVIVFLVLSILVPILYVYGEPERTNYLPGEEQSWIIKSILYPSITIEYFFHTNGDLDVLLGIVVRNYVANKIGILLLILYYLFASGLNMAIRKMKDH